MALTQSTRRSCSSTVSVTRPQCPAPVGLETPFFCLAASSRVPFPDTSFIPGPLSLLALES